MQTHTSAKNRNSRDLLVLLHLACSKCTVSLLSKCEVVVLVTAKSTQYSEQNRPLRGRPRGLPLNTILPKGRRKSILLQPVETSRSGLSMEVKRWLSEMNIKKQYRDWSCGLLSDNLVGSFRRVRPIVHHFLHYNPKSIPNKLSMRLHN